MKRAPRSRQRHDLYAKYHDYDSEISDLLGECGMKPEFFLIDAATGQPAAAYRTTIADPIYENVEVHDMNQQDAAEWLAFMIDHSFVIAGSNAQCLRLCKPATGTEAEIWGISAIHFEKRIWETRAEAEDAGG